MGNGRQGFVYNGPPAGTIPTGWRRTSPLANTAYPIIAEPVGNLGGKSLAYCWRFPKA